MNSFKLYLTAFVFLVTLVPNAFSQAIHLQISPESATATVGSTVTFTISASTLDDVVAMQVDFQWDSEILQLQLPLTNINSSFSPLDINQIDAGQLATQWVNPGSPQTISGTMYELNFTVVGVGTTDLTIQNTFLSPIFATNAGEVDVTFDAASFTGTNMSTLTVNCPNLSFTIPSENDSYPFDWDISASTTCATSSDVTIVQDLGPVSGSTLSAGSYSVAYSFSDQCGNSTTCAFQILVETETVADCPSILPGLTKIGEKNNHAYYLSNNTLTWQNAQAWATANGGYLATISTQSENAFIEGLVSEMIFIGLNDQDNEGNLVWSNGENLSYTNYSNCSWCGDNNDANDYGVFLPWDGSWAFDNIWVSRKFVVERNCSTTPPSNITMTCPENINYTLGQSAHSIAIDWLTPNATTTCQSSAQTTVTQISGVQANELLEAGTYPITYQATDECDNITTCTFTITINPYVDITDCPPTVPGYKKMGAYNGHSYYISLTEKTWTEAQADAANNNGYLASITSLAENNFIQSNVAEMAFIGLNDHQNEGHLTWDSGESIGYTNYSNCSWCGTNNDQNDFGVFQHWDGGWSFDNQWVKRKYILEMECGSTNNGSISSTCPSNINYTLQDGADNAPITWDLPWSSSSCPQSSLVTTTQVSGPPSGSVFYVGSTTISYEFADQCENTSQCSFTITINPPFTGGGCGDIAGYTKLGDYNGHGYYMSAENATWDAANTAAQGQGGYLATMNSQAENDFLKNHLNNNMVFIGYHDATNEGTGAWSNGETVSLDLSYNNSSENDYAVMNFWAGTWEMYNRWVSKRYVMEKACASQAYTINPKQNINSASLSPNPAFDRLTIKLHSTQEGNASITIFSPSGQQLSSSRIILDKGLNQLDISVIDLAKGLYFLKIAGQDVQEILKFIKE